MRTRMRTLCRSREELDATPALVANARTRPRGGPAPGGGARGARPPAQTAAPENGGGFEKEEGGGGGGGGGEGRQGGNGGGEAGRGCRKEGRGGREGRGETGQEQTLSREQRGRGRRQRAAKMHGRGAASGCSGNRSMYTSRRARPAIQPPPPLAPSLPYKVDTSRPSLHTNWTRSSPTERSPRLACDDGKERISAERHAKRHGAVPRAPAPSVRRRARGRGRRGGGHKSDAVCPISTG